MLNISLRRSIALTKVVAEQLNFLSEVTGENFNRLINRLISEEYIRKQSKEK
jgi:hypothetical protein